MELKDLISKEENILGLLAFTFQDRIYACIEKVRCDLLTQKKVPRPVLCFAFHVTHHALWESYRQNPMPWLPFHHTILGRVCPRPFHPNPYPHFCLGTFFFFFVIIFLVLACLWLLNQISYVWPFLFLMLQGFELMSNNLMLSIPIPHQD